MSVPDVDQELTRLLSATREGTAPDAEARTRIRAAVAAGLAAGAGLPLGAATRGARGIKWWLLSAFGAALVVGLVSWLWSPATAPAPAPAVSVESAPASAVVLEAAPSAAPAVSSQISPASGASASLAPVLSVPSKAQAPKGEDPAAELALVSSMQLALRSGNASQVLALVTEHAQRFPQGTLVQEREGARAIARCQLAEPAKRGSILGVFERIYSGSPYAARVRAACAP